MEPRYVDVLLLFHTPVERNSQLPTQALPQTSPAKWWRCTRRRSIRRQIRNAITTLSLFRIFIYNDNPAGFSLLSEARKFGEEDVGCPDLDVALSITSDWPRVSQIPYTQSVFGWSCIWLCIGYDFLHNWIELFHAICELSLQIMGFEGIFF